MSKKVVSFTLPNRPRDPAQSEPRREAPEGWVLASTDPRSPAGHVVIDLSAERTWFELVQLIWMFPWLASWCWLQNAGTPWLINSPPKDR
jgi:hypothetical protein